MTKIKGKIKNLESFAGKLQKIYGFVQRRAIQDFQDLKKEIKTTFGENNTASTSMDAEEKESHA